MTDVNKYETAARQQGIIEPAGLKRGTVIFLECDNDLRYSTVPSVDPLSTI